VGWTYSITDSALDFLAAGQKLTVTYTVTIDDGHGGTVSKLVTVTITGTNDAPAIVADSTTATGSLTENAQGTYDTTSGTIAFQDVDLNDSHTVTKDAASFAWSGGTLSAAQQTALASASTLTFVKSDSTGTGAGSVDWTYKVTDSAITFLAVGETLTVTYTVTVDDGHGGTASQLVTVTITGTNDAPTIVTSSTTATGSLTENAQGTSETVSGTIAFRDVDLSDSHTVSKSDASFTWSAGALTAAQLAALAATSTLSLAASDSTGTGAGSVGWTYSISDSALDFLAVGQKLTVAYTVSVDDGHGGTVSKPVTVTITGTNDAPTIVADSTTATGSLTENAQGASETTSGTIAFQDVDLSDHHTVSNSNASFVWSGGTLNDTQQASLTAASTFTLVKTDSTGTGAGSLGWTYKVNDSAINFLGSGDTLTVNYTVSIDDGHGGTASQLVTVTITGTDVQDVWQSASSGNWDSAANWNHGVPNSNLDAVISAEGTYTVSINNTDAAHSLTVDNPHTTIAIGNNETLNITDALTVDAGILSLTDSTIQAGHWTIQAGSIDLENGSSLKGFGTVSGPIANSGLIQASSNHLLYIAGDITGTGSIQVLNHSTLELGGSVASTQTLTFAVGNGSEGDLILDHALTQPFSAVISGLGDNDNIDLKDLTFTSGHMTATTSYADGNTTLVVSNTCTNQSVTLKLAGDYTHSGWDFDQDSSGTGTIFHDPPAADAGAADVAAAGIRRFGFHGDCGARAAGWRGRPIHLPRLADGNSDQRYTSRRHVPGDAGNPRGNRSRWKRYFRFRGEFRPRNHREFPSRRRRHRNRPHRVCGFPGGAGRRARRRARQRGDRGQFPRQHHHQERHR
jgi:VCBS repeat-containing protein